jgi:hypothetical protein
MSYGAYSTATAHSTTATAPTTATASHGWPSAGVIISLSTACGPLGVSFRLARKLDRNLALEDGLSVELCNGTLRLRRSREINKGVTDGASSARIDRDRHRFTDSKELAPHNKSKEWPVLTQGTP